MEKRFQIEREYKVYSEPNGSYGKRKNNTVCVFAIEKIKKK
jgi:hypothetical protein